MELVDADVGREGTVRAQAASAGAPGNRVRVGNAGIVPSLDGLAPFQIAFVVRDLERAAREFDRLSAGPWRGWVLGPQGEGREYRGVALEWTLRLALNSRSPQYELIEPLDGPSIHADWLAERGEGFHHVAYAVESVAAVTAEMEAAGHPAIARIHSFGASGDGAAVYYDTAEALGFLVEAVEPPGQMPEPDFAL
jgi:catechol 2,3-dioxygenase-like lactoylglutathione lyase family enzyme